MLCPPHPADPLVVNWLARHRDPKSLLLHLIGIPPTILGLIFVPIYLFLISIPIFLLALALFLGGYALQFLGHALDGTEPGEWTLIKKKLGFSKASAVSAAREAGSMADRLETVGERASEGCPVESKSPLARPPSAADRALGLEETEKSLESAQPDQDSRRI